MTARVSPIVLVSGLFMAAWSGDQAAMREALTKRSTTGQCLVQTDTKAAECRSVAPTRLTAHLVNYERTAEPRVVPVFRPAAMASGIYRAVSERGKTIVFSVTDDQRKELAARDLYIGDSSDGVRWYFIRLQKTH